MTSANRSQVAHSRERAVTSVGETRESQAFHRREWLVQRAGWVVMALMLAAGLLGLFGGGPLADRTLVDGTVTLEFERFARRHANTEWIIRPRTAPAGGVLRVAIGAGFARHFRITEIQPEPAAARLERDMLVYEFDARAAAPLVFHVEPRDAGSHEGQVRVGDSASFTLSQFVYP